MRSVSGPTSVVVVMDTLVPIVKQSAQDSSGVQTVKKNVPAIHMDNVMMLADSALAMQIDGDPTVRMPVYASMENVTKRLESAPVNKIGGALSVRMPVIVVPTHNVTKQQEGAFVSQDGGLGAVTTNALATIPRVIN